MEAAEKNKQPGKAVPIVIIGVLLLVVAGLAAALLLRKDEEPGKVQYASEAVVILSEKDMEAASKRSVRGNVGLRYRNDAYSNDGQNFTCYIVNSGSNAPYDAFFTISEDAAFEKQLYLSGLVPPGSGFETLKLDRALGKGSHELYVAVTLVQIGEDGEQEIINQAVHTMDFHVS